jgi:hypothetical protein
LILSVLDPSVKVDPSSTVASHDSLHWHHWSEVEWSIDMETEFFIESFSFILFGFINIDDIPFLVLSTVVTIYDNWSSFFILW